MIRRPPSATRPCALFPYTTLVRSPVRFQQALVDDMPIALLTIDARGAVTPGNKLARRLFGAYLSGARAEDYAIYGATFAKRLAGEGRGGEQIGRASCRERVCQYV